MRSQLGSFGAAAGQASSRSFSDRFGSGVRSLGSAVGGTIVSGVKTAGAVAGGLLATSLFSGFKRFSTIEDALSSMTTQLGDATQAGKLLDEILQVVRGTPFNFDQFAAAGQQLVGFGIGAAKIPGILTAVGEAAATQGSRAGEFADRLVTIFGQVAARGRVQLDDVWRISETGVNALAILANAFGVTSGEMQKLISKGAVPAGKAIDALTQGIVEGTSGAAGATIAFGGTMAGLRQTLTGSFGGFKTAMARFGAAIVGPFGPALTKVFASFSDVFDLLATRVSGFLKRFVASPGFDRFVAVLTSLPERIGPLLDKLSDLGPLVAGLGGAFGIMGAKSLPVIGSLIGGVNPLLAGFAALVAASPELRDVFGDIFDALKPLISQLLRSLRPVIARLVPIIEKLAAAIGPVLGRVLGSLLPVLPPLADAFVEIASAFGDVLIAVLPILPPLADLIVAIAPLLPAVAQLTALCVRLAVAALAPLIKLIAGNKNILIGLGIVIAAIVVPAFIGWAVAAGSAAVAMIVLWAPVIAIVAAVAAVAAGVVWLVRNWSKAWRAIKAVFTAAWGVIRRGLSALGDATSWLSRAFSGAFNVILRAAGFLVSTLITGFRFIASVWLSVVGTIIHGAATAFGWVPGIGGKLKAADKAFGRFKDSFIGTLEDMASAARGWGKNTGANYAEGLGDALPLVSKAATQIARQVGTRLEISSPAELGPLSRGGGPEGWGKRFGMLYAEGLIVSLRAERSRLESELLKMTSLFGDTPPRVTVPVSVKEMQPRLRPITIDRRERRGPGAGGDTVSYTVNYIRPPSSLREVTETFQQMQRRRALQLSRS
jgi:tape measure domain-containing protein